MASITFEYDPASDIATVCGVKYAGEFFRAFASEPGQWLRIMSQQDGRVTVFRPNRETQVQFDLATQAQRARSAAARCAGGVEV